MRKDIFKVCRRWELRLSDPYSAVVARAQWLGRHLLNRPVAGFALFALLISTFPAWAAPVTFAKPATISGDTDVLTSGTLVYAFNLGGTDQTVNKVLFAAANTGHASTQVEAGNITIAATGDPNSVVAVVDAPTFAGDGQPYNSLSEAYKSLLGSADYSNSTTGTLTVTIGGLKVGTTYSVQFFVNDSRGVDRADTITSGKSASDPVVFNTTSSVGGVGQSLIATFTADGETQDFVFAPVTGAVRGDAQVNAVQLRMTSPSGN